MCPCARFFPPPPPRVIRAEMRATEEEEDEEEDDRKAAGTAVLDREGQHVVETVVCLALHCPADCRCALEIRVGWMGLVEVVLARLRKTVWLVRPAASLISTSTRPPPPPAPPCHPLICISFLGWRIPIRGVSCGPLLFFCPKPPLSPGFTTRDSALRALLPFTPPPFQSSPGSAAQAGPVFTKKMPG